MRRGSLQALLALGLPALSRATGTIRASPDPCIADSSGTCAVAVSYHASGVAQAALMASVDGGQEIMVACGLDSAGNGSQSIPWMTAGHSVEFRLYAAAPDCGASEASALAQVTVSALPKPWPAPKSAVGLNAFDLAFQYLGRTSGGDGSPVYQKVTKAMAKKSIKDAMNIGVGYFRVAISGFGPELYGTEGDLDLWLDPETKAAYWSLLDEMMGDLNASGIRIIPSFFWNWVQFPSMTGETVTQMISDPNSKSYGLFLS